MLVMMTDMIVLLAAEPRLESTLAPSNELYSSATAPQALAPTLMRLQIIVTGCRPIALASGIRISFGVLYVAVLIPVCYSAILRDWQGV